MLVADEDLPQIVKAAPEAKRPVLGVQRALLFGARLGRGPTAERRGRMEAERVERAQRAAAEQRALMERRNDELTEDLAAKVSSLRDVAVAVKAEVQESGAIVDNMGNRFDHALDILRSSTARLRTLSKEPAALNFVRMTLFCVMMAFLIYALSPGGAFRRAIGSAGGALHAANGGASFLAPAPAEPSA
eukprot:TRINITY_DN50998_c0_g1_i1.p1 TRINITY_DN50998_c0_g1~~TRINITY_DN50998_c0_g1_i1.p1  ORF type:complete len:202 (-),score=42.34 TRINITY_DN50998_c0_g1_i1:193-759(-)